MNTMEAKEFYDRLARAFDVMTNWSKRLDHELPFIEKILRRHHARSVLDTACGTGWHSIALVRKGYHPAGCDVSPAMIEKARANAAESGVEVRFEVADFSQLDRLSETFDALLCLGNSLPHLLSQAQLGEALRQMRRRLNPGGVGIFHNLNYDLRLKNKPRFFSAEGNERFLVWRFADYGPEFITFHTVLFERSPGDPQWSVQVNSTPQRPLLAQDFERALQDAGFAEIEYFGGLEGSPFDPEKSGDLVLVASLQDRPAPPEPT